MLYLILCVLSLYHPHTLVNSLNDEGFALISFKNAIKDDPEGSLNNWNYSDATPCLWNGITCKELKVVSLSIPRKRLSGFLSSSLGSLSELRHINLRSNKLFGSLPVNLFQVPGLQSLVLYGNEFSGSIPSEIGNLNYLQNLDLSQNFFNGSLPSTLVQCKRLRHLDFSQNNFTGILPTGIGSNLVLLEKLDLSYNNFIGSVPSDLGNLSNLQGTVDLSHNTFNGSIPSSLGNLPEKVYIDLTYNNLTGPIPQNGALINRGPTAFIGNPLLCGPPLKNTCTDNESNPPSYPFLPSNDPPHARHLSKSAVTAIVIGDIIGICVIALLFSYCYSRICAKRKDNFEKDRAKTRKECLCFGIDVSETLSEHIEQHDLVILDGETGFDLDELLKASAFVLGKSGIGIVYKVVLEDGINLAVRRLGEGGSQRFKEFQTEVEAIGKLKHKNIVTLKAYYWSVDEKLLIYEFLSNGNLATAIHGKPGMMSFTPLSWFIRLNIVKGVAKGLVYLHETSPKKYVHGDLKPSNILLGNNMEPKIADFGLGRLANIAGATPMVQSTRMGLENPQLRKQSSVSVSVSSVSNIGCYYEAPEAMKMIKPSQKWDVYSYGVILLEIITGKLPVVQVGNLEMDLPRWINLSIEEKKPLLDVLDPYLAEGDDYKEEEIIGVLKIAMACIQTSPEKRPTMRHVCDVLERL